MGIVKTKSGKRIRVVSHSHQRHTITSNDAEMDARARQAVKAAVAKAEFCKKPIAKYDKTTKKAYIEYANGEKRYVR